MEHIIYRDGEYIIEQHVNGECSVSNGRRTLWIHNPAQSGPLSQRQEEDCEAAGLNPADFRSIGQIIVRAAAAKAWDAWWAEEAAREAAGGWQPAPYSVSSGGNIRYGDPADLLSDEELADIQMWHESVFPSTAVAVLGPPEGAPVYEGGRSEADALMRLASKLRARAEEAELAAQVAEDSGDFVVGLARRANLEGVKELLSFEGDQYGEGFEAPTVEPWAGPRPWAAREVDEIDNLLLIGGRYLITVGWYRLLGSGVRNVPAWWPPRGE